MPSPDIFLGPACKVTLCVAKSLEDDIDLKEDPASRLRDTKALPVDDAKECLNWSPMTNGTEIGWRFRVEEIRMQEDGEMLGRCVGDVADSLP